MSTESKAGAVRINQRFRSPHWCPCTDMRETVRELSQGNRLYLKATLRHMYEETWDRAMELSDGQREGVPELQRTCCLRELVRRARTNALDMEGMLLTEYRPDLYTLRQWFEVSHPGLISAWVAFDQVLPVLPAPQSDVWALLFARFVSSFHSAHAPLSLTHQEVDEWALWVAHILSRMNDAHLHAPYLMFDSSLLRHDMIVRILTASSNANVVTSEFHPVIRAKVNERLAEFLRQATES